MPLKKLILAAFGLVWGVSVGSDARAQEEGVAMEGMLPDTIVVTASRQPDDVRQAGQRIAVWTAADIAVLPVSSLDELLRTAGGVEIQSRAGFGVQSDFTMRGSNFKGVLLLIDGVPLNDPQTGHYLSDFPLPLAAIARIEVLRGPATALYGPDAFGGVVQVFTYAGLRAADGAAAGWAGKAAAQYGAHDLYDVEGVLRHTGGPTTVSAATAWQGTAGEPIFDGQGQRVRSSEGPLRTDFARQAHTAALSRLLGTMRFYARAGVDRRSFNAYHFYTDFSSDRARSDNRTYWLQARLDGAGGAQAHWTVQVAAKQHEGLYTYNPQFASSRDYSRKLLGQAQMRRKLSSALRLIGGISGEVRGIESASLGDHRDAAAGLFLTARWQVTRRLTLNGSGRLDYDAAYGIEATPQLSVAFNARGLTFRAGAGRAVRAPTYTERYIDTAVEEPAGNLGNPSLDPEQGWAAEAGIDVYVLSSLVLHATGFWRQTEDLIDYARRPGEELFVARNILEAETRGLELDVETRAATAVGTLRLAATYTWLGVDLGQRDPNVQYKYALTSARHLVQGAAVLSVGNATLGLRGLWKERQIQAAYGVLHGRLAYQLPVGRQRLLFSGEVRNLFDVDYTEVFDAPMPGRWWILGFALQH